LDISDKAYIQIWRMKNTYLIIFLIPLVCLGTAGIILLFGMEDLAIFAPLAIIGIMVLFFSVIKPLWGYLLFSIALSIRSEEYSVVEIAGSVIRIADIIVAPVFLGWLISAFVIKKEGAPFKKTGIELLLFTFSMYVILSAVWSSSVPSSISKILQLIYAIILFYMTVDIIKTRKYLVMVLWCWLIGGVLATGTTLYDALVSTARATSFMSTNSLDTAEFLVFPLFISIGLLLTARNHIAKLILIMILIFCTGALIATEARGPMLGALAGALFLVFGFKLFRRSIKWLPTALIFILPIAFFWSIAFNYSLTTLLQETFARFIYLIQNPSSDFGVRFRLTLWSGAFKLILSNPLLGIGIGSLDVRLPEFIPVEFPPTQVLHNLYLEILLLLGFLGFILFSCLFVRMFKLVWEIWRETSDHFYHNLLTGMVAGLVAQAVGWCTFGKFIEHRIFWVYYALIIAIARVYRSDKTITHR